MAYLTDAQQQTLAASIRGSSNQDVVDALAAGNVGVLAGIYNEPTAVVVWRTAVTQDEIMQNGFDWTRVDNLSVGAARVWEWLFSNESRSINPSKLNVRAGIEAVWKGTAADLAVRAAVYVHCKRFATLMESLFSSGSGTTGSPSMLGFEGLLSSTDVSSALEKY